MRKEAGDPTPKGHREWSCYVTSVAVRKMQVHFAGKSAAMWCSRRAVFHADSDKVSHKKAARSASRGGFACDEVADLYQAAAGGFSNWCSSPDSYISIMMSEPPMNSPFTYNWGMVGHWL